MRSFCSHAVKTAIRIGVYCEKNNAIFGDGPLSIRQPTHQIDHYITQRLACSVVRSHLLVSLLVSQLANLLCNATVILVGWFSNT